MESSVVGMELLVAVGLYAGLMLSVEVGFRAGRRGTRNGEKGGGGPVGTIQAAALGLLGLLLGFSFSGAASRFIERQDLVTREANAIGTAYLRAELLGEPYRADLRASLRSYTKHHIEVSERLKGGIDADDANEVERQHAAIWKAARDGVEAKPALTVAVLSPVNEVIDLYSTRIAAGRKHLPALVLGLLFACSSIALAAIGFGCGMAGRRLMPLTGALAFLIGTALWTTLDLDHSRRGVIRISDAPLKALKFDVP